MFKEIVEIQNVQIQIVHFQIEKTFCSRVRGVVYAESCTRSLSQATAGKERGEGRGG